FKYYLDLKRYEPKRQGSDIQAIYVTEYYSLEPIEAQRAFFVTGSDVYGPMGKELIPLARESDAKQFMKDHGGKRLLRFDEVTVKLLKELD
ncbi:MAG: nitrous oxide reductase accessory protein NosL, partial [Thermodesulfobacteriota bacterium]